MLCFTATVPGFAPNRSPRLCSSYTAAPALRPNRIRAVASDAPSLSKTKVVTKDETAPKAFSWTNQWYPVCIEADAPVDEPYAFKLFDGEYVLFRLAPGKWAVLDDRCSHRLAPLSEGRIVQDGKGGDAEIECAYHGWGFDGCGKCTRIPQLDAGAKIPRRADVGQYSSKAEYGMIWVFLGDAASASSVPIFLPEEAHGKMGSISPWYMREMNCGFEVLLENGVDIQHVHYLHHRMSPFSNRANGGKAVLSDVEVSDCSIRTTSNSTKFKSVVGIGAPTVLFAFSDISGVITLLILIFHAPTSRSTTRIFYVTIAETRNNMIKLMRSIRPTWEDHLSTTTVTDTDNMLLADIERNLDTPSAWKEKYLTIPKRMDALVTVWRSWMDV